MENKRIKINGKINLEEIKPEFMLNKKFKKFIFEGCLYPILFLVGINIASYAVTSHSLHNGETKQSIENRIEKINPTTLFEKSMKFINYDLGKESREICYWINKEK